MPSTESLALICAVFVLAGWVKGMVGMGLPTVAMGALGLVMAPVQAASLLVVPTLVTNVWQFAVGPAKRIVVRRFASMMLCICLGTALGIHVLTSGSSRWPSIALGSVLVAYASIAFLAPRFAVSRNAERRMSPLIGILTGILTGATGLSIVPLVPYLSTLDLSRDELIQSMGLGFMVASIALAAALGSTASYKPGFLFASIGAVAPALAGMWIGQTMRNRIKPAVFRRCFFSALLLVGSYMIIKGWVA